MGALTLGKNQLLIVFNYYYIHILEGMLFEFNDRVAHQNVTKQKKLNTLRKISMTFICTNIALVDSFEGFPPEIAEEIFKNCVDIKFKDFTNWSEQSRIIELFTDGYPDDFLTSCHLSNSLITINEIDSQIPFLIRRLRALDLSGCSLGDSHDILPQLSSCKELRILSLADNNLTYKGLRIVLRTNQPENMKLQYLDISRNFSISLIGITSYVTPIPSIQNIFISVKASESSTWKIKLKSAGFSMQKTSESPKISNEGWGAVIIEKWIHHGNIRNYISQKEINIVSSNRLEKSKSAQNFYSGKVTHKNLTIHKGTFANQQSDYESYLCKREFISEPTTKRLSKKIRHSFDDTEEDFLSILNTYK